MSLSEEQLAGPRCLVWALGCALVTLAVVWGV